MSGPLEMTSGDPLELYIIYRLYVFFNDVLICFVPHGMSMKLRTAKDS